MALHDYRQLVELHGIEQGDFVAVELVTHERRPIRLHAQLGIDGGSTGVVFLLDESDAGAIVDAIAGALRVLASPPD